MTDQTVNGIEFIRVAGSAAAAQTDVVSSIVDLKDFDRILATAALGDVSDGCVLEFSLEFGDESDLSDAAAHVDLDGNPVVATFTAGASDADGKILAINHASPAKRYVRARLKRTVANAEVDAIKIYLLDSNRIGTVRPADDAVAAVDSFG